MNKTTISWLLLFTVCCTLSVHAQIRDLTYHSPLNQQDIPIKVYLPPGYATGNDRYPVVYNLHGGGTPERQWDRTRATLTRAMNERQVRPLIYVYVNGLGNTNFVNTAEGKFIERSIVEELIPFIDGQFRTIAKKEARAVDGFSMGGYGCLMLALRHPDLFSAVVSYGAALVISGGSKVYKEPEDFEQYAPRALALPGSPQMKYLRRLIESRPFLSRVPDDGTVLDSPAGEKETRVQVTRGAERNWAMYYISDGHANTPGLLNLKGPQLKAWWFNPRDGQLYDNDGNVTDKPFGTFANNVKKVVFKPPVAAGARAEDRDWVLVLDNAMMNYAPPGRRER